MQDISAACPSRCAFICPRLLRQVAVPPQTARRSPLRAGGGALRAQMLHEAHAPPLAGTSVTTRSPWQADHLPPAGRSLPVPTRRGGTISLDSLGLPVALSAGAH